jgi:hypothetical protein
MTTDELFNVYRYQRRLLTLAPVVLGTCYFVYAALAGHKIKNPGFDEATAIQSVNQIRETFKVLEYIGWWEGRGGGGGGTNTGKQKGRTDGRT